MKTVEYICKKFYIDLKEKSPFWITCGRWRSLPRLFNELGFKIGAEIGVQNGVWSENLFKFIPDLKMFCIDKWETYSDYEDIKEQELCDESYNYTKKILKDFNCKIIKKHSMDAVKDFEDESLDFVFLDGNHAFEYITEDIAKWSKKVCKGGIVSGHDYWTSKKNTSYKHHASVLSHVEDVVQAWTHSHRIHPWFVLRGNSSKSWMWVKE